MTERQKSLVIKAIKIRMKYGETLEEILASYPKLTDAEKQELRDAITE